MGTDFPICSELLVSCRQIDYLEDLVDSGSFMVVRVANHIKGGIFSSIVMEVHFKMIHSPVHSGIIVNKCLVKGGKWEEMK